MATPTTKQMASRHARQLVTMAKKVLDLSNQWDEVDQYNLRILEGLHDKMHDVAREMREAENDKQG